MSIIGKFDIGTFDLARFDYDILSLSLIDTVTTTDNFDRIWTAYFNLVESAVHSEDAIAKLYYLSGTYEVIKSIFDLKSIGFQKSGDVSTNWSTISRSSDLWGKSSKSTDIWTKKTSASDTFVKEPEYR